MSSGRGDTRVDWYRQGVVALLTLGVQSASVWAITPVLTRVLPADAYGAVAQNMVVAVTLGQLLSLGLATAIVRLHHDLGDPVSARLVGTGIFGAALVGGLLALTPHLLQPVLAQGASHRMVRLVVMLSVALAGANLIAVQLRSAGKGLAAGALALTPSVISPVAGIVMVEVSGATADAYFLGASCFAGVFVTTAWWTLGLSVGLDRRTAGRALRLSLPTLPHLAGRQLLDVGDRVVVGAVLGSVAVGQYHAAYLMGAAPFLLLGAVNNAWAPSVFSRPGSQRIGYVRNGSLHLVRLAVSAAVSVACLAPFVLPIIYPGSGREMVQVTAVVVVAAPAQAVYLVGSAALLSVERVTAIAVCSVGAALLNIGLTIVLAPMGLAAVAVSTTVAVALLSVTVYWFARKQAGLPRLDGIFPLVVVAMSAVGVLMVAPEPPTWPWMILRVVVLAAAVATGQRSLRASFRGFGG